MKEQIKRSIQQLQFTLAEFTFHISARETLWLPAYKGSAFRGGFGNVFKKVCCVQSRSQYCNDCQLNTACAYAYIFETPQTQTNQTPIQSTNLPHPFVIVPPLTTRQKIEAGEKLSFQLTLIGRGLEFLPYFVYAFDELGRTGVGRERGQYVLEQVTDTMTRQEIYHCASQTLTSDFKVIEFWDLCDSGNNRAANGISVKFLTPTRILFHNQLVDELSFELLLRNLLRRASLLAKLHCNQNWELDYKQILNFAAAQVHLSQGKLSWQDWERYSRRQQQRHQLGGFIGTVEYKGDIAPFLPLIRLGQFIHLGKNTSFGMGKYVIDGWTKRQF